MNNHTQNSSFREKLIEHLFVGALLKLSWLDESCDLEVSKPEVDNSGYDIILESKRVIRHVQLKASYIGGKTSRQKIHIDLAKKQSGCVVWIYFDSDTLDLGPFYFFGGSPGDPLPSIEHLEVAKHTKANAEGEKLLRKNVHIINKGAFTKVDSIEGLYHVLFGSDT